MKRPEWMDEALCREVDPELFFPEKGCFGRDAIRVCAKCPVQPECLDWALERRELDGVWGGFTANERRHLRRGVA